MSELHRITIDPARCGGRPCLRDLRVRVGDVLNLLAAGSTRVEILEDYPLLEDGDITAALEYAARESDRCSAYRAGRRFGAACCLMRFLVDAQLPPAMARWFVANGHTASHVADHGLASATDTAIWIIALDLGAVIVTKDRDFADRRVLSKLGPAVVWLRLANTRRGELLDRFDRLFPSIVSAPERGEVLVEVI